MRRTEEQLEVHFHNAEGDLDFTSAGLVVDAPVRIEEPIFGADFDYLALGGARGDDAEADDPLAEHGPLPRRHRRDRSGVYPDEDQFWDDLSAAYAEQVRMIAERGCPYLQLDDTSLAYLNDPEQRANVAAQGRDAEHQHERYIRQINAAIKDRPEGLPVTTHMCRGNYRSSWAASGSYDFVAEALFGGLDVDGFFLEYDDERSGGFEPLRFVPPGKQVVLGLVTTKSPVLESKDDLKRRVDEAAKYVDLDQLCLSPQCGFSSTVEGNDLTQEEEVAKLRLVVETAEEIWG